MSHREQLEFIQTCLTFLDERAYGISKVLEIGSYDYNGTIRSLIGAKNYIGVDLIEGPGVDLVYDGLNLNIEGLFDLSISSECFEHDPNYLFSFFNMYRLAKEGGVVIFTCAGPGRLEHGTQRTNAHESPGTSSVGINHYKNLRKKDFTSKIDFSEWFSDFKFFKNNYHKDLYFIGIKKIQNEKVHLLDLDVLESSMFDALAREKEAFFKINRRPLKYIEEFLTKVLLKVGMEELYQRYFIMKRKFRKKFTRDR